MAGLAALLFAVDPNLTNSDVRSISRPLQMNWALPGLTKFFGNGRINAHAAVLAALGNNPAPPPPPPPPPPGAFTLDASGFKVKGLQKADLNWSGTNSAVDVSRDGTPIEPDVSGTSYTDNIDQRGGGSYVYQVCEAGTAICSNEATVVF